MGEANGISGIVSFCLDGGEGVLSSRVTVTAVPELGKTFGELSR